MTHGFTGQEEDSGTGLVYMHARYYDPQIGQFVSPDTLVPDPSQLLDYNRYLYARANPLQVNDPSGHLAEESNCDNTWCWQNRWYNAHGFEYNPISQMWDSPIDAAFGDLRILQDVLTESGISTSASLWVHDQLATVVQGVVALANKVGSTLNLSRLLENPIRFVRLPSAIPQIWPTCEGMAACQTGQMIQFYDAMFEGDIDYQRGTVVHELAHAIDAASDYSLSGEIDQTPGGVRVSLTTYSIRNDVEYFGEAVADWVYGSRYKGRELGRVPLAADQTEFLSQHLR